MALTEIIQSIYLTFLSGVPRFFDGMFQPECEGLLHVVRAMLIANVRSQTLKIEKIVLTHFVFTKNLVENFGIPRFRFTAAGADSARAQCARF